MAKQKKPVQSCTNDRKEKEISIHQLLEEV